jgi:hypothetical protein
MALRGGRGRLRLQHGDLLTESKDLKGGVAPRAEEHAEYRDHRKDEFDHEPTVVT